MALDINSMLRRLQQMQQVQKVQKTGVSQGQNPSDSTQGSLMDRLNGLDNQLNNGGGVSLPDSSTNQVTGMNDSMKKKKLM